MAETVSNPGSPGVAAGRLGAAELARNFSDLHPPLGAHEARVESERCYFCHDAPCQQACPTSIDIPLFIRQISAANPLGAGRTIFDENIFGGMCARVCPTETLCEEACVREHAEGKPVRIGLLQRFATDAAMAVGKTPFTRKPPSGKRVAVVGAGPAGLSCAHALALEGHAVTVFEAREKSAGLNEYGIAAYKVPDDFAAKEVAFILSLGGIAVEHGKALGRDFDLGALRAGYDAVFLGLGLGAVNALGLAEAGPLANVVDAVAFIAKLRQAGDLGSLAMGRHVVVVGGGMTAIDAAVQSRRLGAERVTILYRRGVADMKASRYERELAQKDGAAILPWTRPRALIGEAGKVSAVLCEATREVGGKLMATGETFRLEADMVFAAVGQKGMPGLFGRGEALRFKDDRVEVDAERRTSLDKVWAGGDCVFGGKNLTVSAVEDGKRAARSIHAALTGAGGMP